MQSFVTAHVLPLESVSTTRTRLVADVPLIAIFRVGDVSDSVLPDTLPVVDQCTVPSVDSIENLYEFTDEP